MPLTFSIVLFAIFTYIRAEQSFSGSRRSKAYFKIRKSVVEASRFGLVGLATAIVVESVGVGMNL